MFSRENKMYIYTNSIVNAVVTILGSWETFISSGVTIEEHQEFNTDPNRTPWIGIYSPVIIFDSFRAQTISPFMATVNIPIYTQVGDFAMEFMDGGRRLNELSAHVFTAVSCDRELMNTVEIVKSVSITPYNRSVEDSDPLFSDLITIEAEVFA
jgi:hypothetical protein